MITTLTWLANAILGYIPFVSLAVVIVAIVGLFFRVSRQWEFALFGVSWISLALGGIYCRDVSAVIVTFPLMVMSLALYAVFWRSSSLAWSGMATAIYWVGVLSVVAGAIYFGLVASEVQCFERNCHGAYTAPRPNVARALALWSTPALVFCLGLRVSKQFSKLAIAGAGTSLLLLNPIILWMVEWLQPSLGM